MRRYPIDGPLRFLRGAKEELQRCRRDEQVLTRLENVYAGGAQASEIRENLDARFKEDAKLFVDELQRSINADPLEIVSALGI